MLEFIINARNSYTSDNRIAKTTSIICGNYGGGLTELKDFILSIGNPTVRKYEKVYNFVKICFDFMDNFSNRNSEFHHFYTQKELQEHVDKITKSQP